MAYCTLADIENELTETALIQLTDDDDAGEVDEDKIDQAIETADAVINAYCAKYNPPFATVPVLVKTLSVDIAIYNLYSRRVEEYPEVRQKNYDNAISLLKSIANGTAALDIPTGVTDAGGPENTKTLDDRHITFTNTEGY